MRWRAGRRGDERDGEGAPCAAVRRRAALRAAARRALWVALVAVSAWAPAAAAGEGEEPLRAREETPEDLERLRARPRFLKPSEIPGAAEPEPTSPDPTSAGPAPATFGTPLPSIATSSSLRLSDYQPPSVRARHVGPFVELGGEPFEARPTHVRPLEAGLGLLPSDPDGQLSARALYAYVSGPRRDWTGVELAGSVDVASGVTAGVLFRHELRDEAAELAVASLSAPLGPSYRLVGTLGMGFGGAFVPLVDLAAELRGPIPGSRKVHFGVGGRATFWQEQARSFEGTLAGIFWDVGGLSGEQRVHVRIFDAGASPRLMPGISTVLMEGEAGDRQLVQRLSLSMLPRSAPGAVPVEGRAEATVDAWLGVREWLAPEYGFVAGLDFGAQRAAYVRVGADFSAFVTF